MVEGRAMIYLTQSAYARMHGVSRTRVSQWVATGRLPHMRFAERVVLIDKRTPRPECREGGRPVEAKKNLLTNDTAYFG